MATHTYLRSPWNIVKRLRVSSPFGTAPRACISTTQCFRAEPEIPENLSSQDAVERDLLEWADQREIDLPHGLRSPRRTVDGKVVDPRDLSKLAPVAEEPRLPRSVQALYLTPLRRQPTHGIPVCDLQLRSYSVRNLEFMADFAMRAAFYLNLAARGPVPLPRITERWTVPRDNFIFKKSQENWERITLRRLVQIQDGHPEAVQKWLAFVKKWCWYGVGMKANVWEWEGLDVAEKLDKNEDAVQAGLRNVQWDLIVRKKGLETSAEVAKLLDKQGIFSSGAERRPRQAVATDAT